MEADNLRAGICSSDVMDLLKVGDEFPNYENFQHRLLKYQDTVFVNFCIRDSTTIERARMKQPKKTFQ